MNVIPTTWLTHGTAFQQSIAEAIKIDDRGLAVRVPISALDDAGFPERMRRLIVAMRVAPESVDIIVEFGFVGANARTLAYVCRRLPMLNRWRTFTVLAGSFPPNLMELKRPGQYEIPRHELVKWMSEVHGGSPLPRRPAFGDYTIQHPVYIEPVVGANPSVSIRYASETFWIIMRGQALRKRGGGTRHEQYPANAELLCARKEFVGPHYSAGDEYIWSVGSHSHANPGTPETWLRAGINHHMVLTVRQIQSAAALSATAAERS